MRDVNNKTILHFICDKLKKEDEEFVNIKNDFKSCYYVAQYNLKDEESKIKEVRGAFEKAKNNFETVKKKTQE